MEFWIKLLPNFLREAKSAELSEGVLKEVYLWLLEFNLSKLEEKRFCLAKISSSRLTQQDC